MQLRSSFLQKEAARYRGRGVVATVGRGDGVGLGRRGDFFGEGVGVGIAAASSGWTGSARRTSGSDAGGAGARGVTEGAAVTVGVGATGVVSAAGAAVLSAGCACGATILSETVAVAMGEVPGAGVGLGLSRCICRNHFITVNPTTRTTTPMINGMSDPRLPLPGLLLRLRTVTGRIGSGSGAS